MKRYTEKHEWVELDGAVAVVGITEFAASELGDITYVELPPEGDAFTLGDVLSVVESVKAASDIYAPVGGVVSAVNSELESNPALVNEAAEGEGWICKLSEVDAAELDGLMDAEQYAAYLKSL